MVEHNMEFPPLLTTDYYDNMKSIFQLIVTQAN